MKTKTKILTFLSAILFTSTFANNFISNKQIVKNNLNLKKEQKSLNNNNFSSLQDITIKAGLIGAESGEVTIKPYEGGDCVIKSCSSDFKAKGEFNFNDGHFYYKGTIYTIVGIDDGAFFPNLGHTLFERCVITFPSTIKRIGQRAFKNNQSTSFSKDEIIGIHFENNGVQCIEHNAFAYCGDLSDLSNVIVFPNSLEFLAHDAFYNCQISKFDFTKIDHPIETDGDIDKSFQYEEQKREQITIYHVSDAMIITNCKEIKELYIECDDYATFKKYGKIIVEGEELVKLKLPIFTLLNENTKISSSSYVFNYYFNIEYFNKDNCRLTEIGSGAEIKKDFSFNNGCFTYDGSKYVISEIAKETFKVKTGWYFKESNLTIPSTIKKIDDEAFYNNSCSVGKKEIIGLNFEEGVVSIGKSAFEKCNDIKQDTLKLPNSLKKLGNRAFVNTGKLKYFDFTALDHVIDIDSDPLSKNGCLPTKQIKKIYFKDEATKNLYLNNLFWKSCAKYFEVKPTPQPWPKSENVVKVSDSWSTTTFTKFNIEKMVDLWESSKKYISFSSFAYQRENITNVWFSNINYLKEIKSNFLINCPNLEWIDLLGMYNLETIDDFFLINSYKLNKLVLPNSVKIIGNDFLKNSKTIENITLPSNLKEIGHNFLTGCTNLKTIDLSNIKDNVLKYKFNFAADSQNLEHIYVDKNLLSKYENDPQWSKHFKTGVICAKN